MIPEQIPMSVYEVIGNSFYIVSDDWQKVHDQILADFWTGKNLISDAAHRKLKPNLKSTSPL